MKIVQSLWFNNKSNKIDFNAGWLDLRYHLMSWAYSNLTLKKNTTSIELITDCIGADILVGSLSLNYSNINLLFDTYQNPLADTFWAIKKIYAYSIHEQPFVFVDGDVYNFNLNAVIDKSLICQNFEENYIFYRPVQDVISSTSSFMKSYLKNNQLDAINTGIIGGTNYAFFKSFMSEVDSFVIDNIDSLQNAIKNHSIDAKYINVWLEQYFIYNFAKYSNCTFEYYLKNLINKEDDYRLLADFTKLPSPNTYMHLMHLTKINPTVCEQLAQRLFIESPELYEKVETVCRQLQSSHHYLDNQPVAFRLPFERTCSIIALLYNGVYSLKGYEDEKDEILKIIHDSHKQSFQNLLFDVFNYESQLLKFKTQLPLLPDLWESWHDYSKKANKLLLLNQEDFLQSQIKRSAICYIIDSEWNWAETNEFYGQLDDRNLANNINTPPSYYEVILYIYLHQNIVREHLLDELNILILEVFSDGISIKFAIKIILENVKAYNSEIDEEQLSETILSRIRHFLYNGILIIDI